MQTPHWRQWLLLPEAETGPERRVSVVYRKQLEPDTAVRLLIKGLTSEQINEVCYQLRCGVPSMAVAIELVSVHVNTTIIDSRILSERLRLTALHVDARYFEELPRNAKTFDGRNAIQLELKCDFDSDAELVERARRRDPIKEEPVLKYVYASDLKVVSTHSQHPFPIRAARSGKPLAVLAPHQALHISALAIKGRGAEHAAWIPVALEGHLKRPIVELVKPVCGPDAALLVARCPQRVFALQTETKQPHMSASSAEPEVIIHSRPRDKDKPAVTTGGGAGGGQSPPPLPALVVAQRDQCLGSAVCKQCTSAVLPFAGSVRLDFAEGEFLVRVETVNGLPAAELWNQAVELALAPCASSPSLEASGSLFD